MSEAKNTIKAYIKETEGLFRDLLECISGEQREPDSWLNGKILEEYLKKKEELKEDCEFCVKLADWLIEEEIKYWSIDNFIEAGFNMTDFEEYEEYERSNLSK